ncbi:MAG: YbaK/EbsC family protein [Waddliaceae bacterium]
MAISSKLKKFLDEKGVDYEAQEHPLAYTAQQVAGEHHVPGKQMVKSVIVKSGDRFIMCVLPSTHLIDFDKLKNVVGNGEISLADEEEIAQLFPDYEVGAEPPFGYLYGLEVLADRILQEDDEITFNAGTHTDVVKMKFKDYLRLESPKLVDIGTHI